MKISAVLFDLDGTLRDTRDTIYTAVKHAVKEHSGQEVSNEDLADYMHHHSHVHQRFASHVSLAEFERVFHAKLYEMLPSVELYQHAVETIVQLHKAGQKLAIISSAKPAEIRQFLERAGIAQYFDGIAGDDGVLARKPSPEPVLAAIDQLGVAVGECVMVGDMRVDMQAAAAAGVPVKVGITHGFEDADLLKAAGADYIIDSLAELPAVIDNLVQA
ncbi:HAD family hydrolase [soil metagenome]